MSRYSILGSLHQRRWNISKDVAMAKRGYLTTYWAIEIKGEWGKGRKQGKKKGGGSCGREMHRDTGILGVIWDDDLEEWQRMSMSDNKYYGWFICFRSKCLILMVFWRVCEREWELWLTFMDAHPYPTTPSHNRPSACDSPKEMVPPPPPRSVFFPRNLWF
jgi:hypothetical protein